MKVYLGIDAGSVTTKLAILSDDCELVAGLYLPTQGRPLAAVQQGLKDISRKLSQTDDIGGVAATGSARYLAGTIVGADLVKNEITCHAVAAMHYMPEVRTVIEIGGQDSKLIIIRDGMVSDFAMNTVCAAGTGSFLDHQAGRLNISIEEFSRQAMLSERPVRINGKCTVFAESDMVHRQQMGYQVPDIIYGLCRALVHNYLTDVASGKTIEPPVVFQGGVAFNRGIIRAFREELDNEIIVPDHNELMGAIGAAMLVREEMLEHSTASKFRGFNAGQAGYKTAFFECTACPVGCEVARVSVDDKVLAYWGGRCDMWERTGGESMIGKENGNSC